MHSIFQYININEITQNYEHYPADRFGCLFMALVIFIPVFGVPIYSALFTDAEPKSKTVNFLQLKNNFEIQVDSCICDLLQSDLNDYAKFNTFIRSPNGTISWCNDAWKDALEKYGNAEFKHFQEQYNNLYHAPTIQNLSCKKTAKAWLLISKSFSSKTPSLN